MAIRYHFHIWPGVPLALASAALFGAVTPIGGFCLVLWQFWQVLWC
jgi:uncharacterized membrane protein YgdD (TMEM256/DUF423 family)